MKQIFARRSQINQLMSAYPNTRLVKTTQDFEDYQVPLVISVSILPLYVGVTVPAKFPDEKP